MPASQASAFSMFPHRDCALRPFKLDVLSEVEIRVEGASVVGVVRNCTLIRTNEFHVGIELRPRSNDDQFLRHLSLLRHDR
jgi:hypothetical protein